MPTDTPSTPTLLLTPRQAADALAIGERSLWRLTAPRGPIPVVRLGRSVRYSVGDLERWIDDARTAEAPAQEIAP